MADQSKQYTPQKITQSTKDTFAYYTTIQILTCKTVDAYKLGKSDEIN